MNETKIEAEENQGNEILETKPDIIESSTRFDGKEVKLNSYYDGLHVLLNLEVTS